MNGGHDLAAVIVKTGKKLGYLRLQEALRKSKLA